MSLRSLAVQKGRVDESTEFTEFFGADFGDNFSLGQEVSSDDEKEVGSNEQQKQLKGLLLMKASPVLESL